MLDTVEKVIQRYNTKLILIDNLMTALECDPKNDLYREQSKFVGRVKGLAMKYNVAILLIAHPRKESANAKGLTNDSVSGSADITNRVDIVMSYVKNGDNEPQGGKISVTKNRLTGNTAHELPVLYGQKSKRICSNNTERDKEFSCFVELTKEEITDGILF